ncbi:alpha/beta-hydrolase [Periconia macrospinosa]|uniref:Alpha/beta-hydrolase n=1 Tax=Periconia macrospinosa TaxID=97972 RepID=A0A2V1DEW9_9PLEO|nr:alpha/beta-hydrolase [Periconia macrospinosa]
MSPGSPHRVVEIKTIDGTDISGWLYEVPGPSPAIIMSHGFNCVKEMALPEVAELFHKLGYNVLLYDARRVGKSGGQPRNLIEPLQFAEDLSDVYTYVTRLSSVDSNSIILWGLSFGSVVSACCAAVDHRCKAVIMVCPLFSYVQPEREEQAFAQLIKDRISQLRGNEPYSLQPFTPDGNNPIGMAGAEGPGGLEAYNFMQLAAEKGAEGFRDRIALQTYQKLAMFRPKEYLDMIRAPVMTVIPELDDISSPQEQAESVARIKAPSTVYWAKGKGHLNVVTGEEMPQLVEDMDKFIKDVLNGAGP